MSKVINLSELQIAKGEPMFVLCPKCRDETMFMPIALQGRDKCMFISQLVCYGPKCHGTDIEEGNETVMSILNGYIEEINDHSR